MPIVKLTALSVASLPAIGGRRTDYTDALLPGFVLRVSATGARSFGLAYWSGGKKHRWASGDASEMDLVDARARAREALERVGRGLHPEPPPVFAPSAELTVGGLVGRCLAELALRPTTRKEWQRLLAREISASSIGKMPAGELRRRHVKEWTIEIKARSGWTANHAFEVLRRAYSWGKREELVEANPCSDMPKPHAATSSERVLSADELAALVLTIRRRRTWPDQLDVVELLLLTGVRRAAVLGMQRGELEDLDGKDPRWVVPGGPEGRSKSGRAHVVPLSHLALAVVRRRLEATQGNLLFGATGRKDKVQRAAWWPSTFTAWLKNHVASAAAAAARRDGAPAPAIARWTIHNLRHTMGTHMTEDLGIAFDVVSLILGHTVSGPVVSRIYNRATRHQERRTALEAWARWLDALGDRQAPGRGNVVPFGRA